MKIYVAAPFSWKNEMKEFALELENLGITVTSSWLDEHASPNATLDQFTDAEHLEIALTDVRDIDRADAILLFTLDPNLPPKPRGGRHWEAGYAYGTGKEIYIVGPRENIFHFLPEVKVFSNKQEAVQFLTARNSN